MSTVAVHIPQVVNLLSVAFAHIKLPDTRPDPTLKELNHDQTIIPANLAAGVIYSDSDRQQTLI